MSCAVFSELEFTFAKNDILAVIGRLSVCLSVVVL